MPQEKLKTNMYVLPWTKENQAYHKKCIYFNEMNYPDDVSTAELMCVCVASV